MYLCAGIESWLELFKINPYTYTTIKPKKPIQTAMLHLFFWPVFFYFDIHKKANSHIAAFLVTTPRVLLLMLLSPLVITFKTLTFTFLCLTGKRER